MMSTTSPGKDATIQIRLPAAAKHTLAARAKKIGMSISEYARASLLTDGKFQRDVEEFWVGVEESRAEAEAGLTTPTSAAELAKIIRANCKKD
jgi:hypothetical protein